MIKKLYLISLTDGWPMIGVNFVMIFISPNAGLTRTGEVTKEVIERLSINMTWGLKPTTVLKDLFKISEQRIELLLKKVYPFPSANYIEITM